MRFRLDATGEELRDKGERLVETLAKSLFYANPDLSEILEKALPRKEPVLKYPALREMKAEADKEYAATMKRMLSSIGDVLDQTGATNDLILEKAGGPYVGPQGGLWEDPQHTRHWTAPTSAGIPEGLEAWATKRGGKVVPQHSDPNKVVVKVSPEHVKDLLDMKAKWNLTDQIITGGHYAMLAVPRNPVQKAPESHAPVAAHLTQLASHTEKPAGVQSGKSVSYAANHDWKPHTSVGEASAWAKARGIDVAYEDLATANETNQAISEQHPYVQTHTEFVGTEAQVAKWAEKHPEINERAMTDAKHPQDLRHFHLGGAIALAHPTTAKPYTRSVVIVANSYGTAAQSANLGKLSTPGFSRGNSLADTLRHEYGHVEGFVFRHLYPNGQGQPSAWEIWKAAAVGALKHAKHDVMKQVSEYGATNPHECWAEVSVMRRQGVPLPQWVQVAIKKMKIDEVPWEKMAAATLGGGK